MEGGVEGAVLNAEGVTGDFVDGGPDGVAVEVRAAVEDFQDEEIEGALEGGGFVRAAWWHEA